MDPDRLVVVAVVLFLLGLSYVAAVVAFASAYLVPATLAYLAVAALLLVRLVPARKND
jgi:hypothetical protein